MTGQIRPYLPRTSPRWPSTRSSTRPTPRSPGAAGCAARSSRPAGPQLDAACAGARRLRRPATPSRDAGLRACRRGSSSTRSGPVWRGGTSGEAALLRLVLPPFRARSRRTPAPRSLAFPAISTGIFGYPGDPAAEVAVRTLHACAGDLDVTLVAFDAETFASLRRAARLTPRPASVVRGDASASSSRSDALFMQ